MSFPVHAVCTNDAFLASVSPLQGFTVDGEHDSSDDIDSYVNKCVEVVGQGDSEDEGIDGFVMTGMTVLNCG